MAKKVVVTRTKTIRCDFNCPELDTPPEISTLDPEGDLHLIVAHNECIVNPGTIRRDGDGNAVLTCSTVTTKTITENNESGDDSTSDDNNTEDNTEDDYEDGDDGITPEWLQSQLADARCHDHKKAVKYVVCSKTLCRSSLFFKRLLYGSFSESKKLDTDDQWTVHLSEDNPTPMKTVLSIAHGTFQYVPTRPMSPGGLYDLTILSNKYDLTHLLRPFAQGWVKDVRKDALVNRWVNDRDVVKCLWCAWELGDVSVMEECINRISSECHLDDQEQLAYDYQWRPWVVFQDILDPPGIVGK